MPPETVTFAELIEISGVVRASGEMKLPHSGRVLYQRKHPRAFINFLSESKMREDVRVERREDEKMLEMREDVRR